MRKQVCCLMICGRMGGLAPLCPCRMLLTTFPSRGTARHDLLRTGVRSLYFDDKAHLTWENCRVVGVIYAVMTIGPASAPSGLVLF